MITVRRRPGGWVDVDRELLVYFGRDNKVHVELNGVESVLALPPNEAPCLYLRCALTPAGAYGIVCQGQSGAALLSLSGHPFIHIGQCGGQNAVEIIVVDQEFWVLRQTGATTASVKKINLQDGHVTDQDFTIPHTSQGFWDGLTLTDTIRASVPGMFFPSVAGDLTIGQHRDIEATVYKYKNETGILFLGASYEPRVTYLPTSQMWRIVTRSNNHEFIDAVASPPFTSVIVPPKPPTLPPPPVTPPPQEPVMSLRQTIESVRSKFGSTMNDDQCVALCNEVAWIHRADGWGLSKKESGTRGRRYDGQECCHDVVMLKDGRYWDILTAAGGASTPNWSDTPGGVITDPNRGWIAPIVPQGATPEPPPVTPPPVTPPPSVPPPTVCKFVPCPDHTAELALLSKKVDDLVQLVAEIRVDQVATAKRLEELTQVVLAAIDGVRIDVANLPGKFPKPEKCRLRF